MSNRKSKNILAYIITGILVIAFALIITKSDILSNYLNKDHKNISIAFFDQSAFMENPSGKIIIDGKEFFSIDSISKSNTLRTRLSLPKGQHTIEISTIDDKYKLTDTIAIDDYPSTYSLWITYYNNPAIKDFIRKKADKYYQQQIKDNNYSQENKAAIYNQIFNIISKESKRDTSYKPIAPSFSFKLKDYTSTSLD